MLALALLLAGASVLLARNWLASQVRPQVIEVAAEPQVRLARVVIAARPLHFGEAIRREHLREVAWPVSSRPPGAFGSLDEILEEQGQPRIALRSIEMNEPVLKSKISGFADRTSLSYILSPELRATTIRVNDVNGVAGFVLPGDRVDVLLTRQANHGKAGEAGSLVTDVLLQDVKVLAVDQDTAKTRKRPAIPSTVTLEVTPIQVQKLTLAQRLGHLSLSLRHITDAAVETPRTISLRDLTASRVTPPPIPYQRPEPTGMKPSAKPTLSTMGEVLSVRIVRGVTVSKYEVRVEGSPLEATRKTKTAMKKQLPTSNLIAAPSRLLISAGGARTAWGGAVE